MCTAVEVCEEHQVFLSLYDDGNPEYGPCEPYLDCHLCREELEHPMIYCEVCKEEKRTTKQSLVMPDFDPTTAYHLECGHMML